MSPTTRHALHYREEVVAGRCDKIVGVFTSEDAAKKEIVQTCATPDAKQAFAKTCSWPYAEICTPDNSLIEPFDLLPVLDDWVGKKPDARDFEAVLKENDVVVEWNDTLVDQDGNKSPANEFAGWGFYWKNGAIHIGQTTETIARKAAALFVSLWLRRVSASFCDKLMDGFIVYLERQENTSLTFLADVHRHYRQWNTEPFFRLTREKFCTAALEGDVEPKIIQALDPQPDKEIIVTFTKRKKCP